MLRKFLVVGLGGSGTLTLRLLQRELRRRLREAQLDDSIPKSWSLVAFDVKAFQERGGGSEIAGTEPLRNFHGLTEPDLKYREVYRERLMNRRSPGATETRLSAIDEVVGGWLPDPSDVHVPIDEGAGQFRAIGRAISLGYLDEIARHITDPGGEELTDELTQLTKAFGGEIGDSEPKPIPIVIGSMAGGAGAGMLMDVCDVLRHKGGGTEGWGDYTIALMYAPEVFNDDDLKEKVQSTTANALALLSEILAGAWWDGNWHPAEAAFFGGAGLMGHVEKRGPGFPFVIGRATTGDLAHPHRFSVFESTAKMVASWMTSPAAQHEFVSYINTNKERKPSDSKTPFTGATDVYFAAGYGSVGLGRDRFAKYATERLARGAVERLLEGHVDPTSRAPQQQQLESLVATQWSSFLDQSRLNERGGENNQVVDALHPGEAHERPWHLDYRDKLLNRFANILDETGAGWIGLFENARAELEPELEAKQQAATRLKAQAWMSDIQHRLVALVERTGGHYGIPTTLGLLRKLDREVDLVTEEIEAESRHVATRGTQRFIDTRDGQFANGTGRRFSPAAGGTGPVEEAALAQSQAMWSRTDAYVRQLAAVLLAGLRTGFIQPLRDALADAHQELRLEESQKQAEDSNLPVRAWSTVESPPERLRPAFNQVLMEPIEGYQEQFARQIQATVGVEGAGGERRAIGEVVRGLSPDDSADDRVEPGALVKGTFMHLDDEWLIDDASLLPAGERPRAATFTIRATAGDLLARAEAWVKHNSPIGEYVSETLGDYLRSDHPEAKSRAERFAADTKKALRRARPLSRLETNALTRTHGVSAPQVSLMSTTLPIPIDHPAFAPIATVFEREYGLQDVARLADSAPVAEVQFTTFLARPYDFPAFTSVTEPITKRWREVSSGTTPSDQAGFWQWKRARRLPDFLPLPARKRRALVRGWVTADILKLVRVDATGRGGQDLHVQVGRPRRKGSVSFPTPLLGAPVSGTEDLLAAVLETLPMGLATFGAEGNPSRGSGPLDAYQLLLELGEPGRGAASDTSEYPSLNENLDLWIRKGSTASHIEWIKARPDDNEVPAAFNPASTAEERTEYLVQRIHAKRNHYEQAAAKAAEELLAVGVASTPGPHGWELEEDLMAAWDHILHGLTKVGEGPRKWTD